MNGQSGGHQDGDEGFRLAIIFLLCLIILIFLIGYFEYERNAVIGAISWAHIVPFATATRLYPALGEIPFLGAWLFAPSEMALSFLERGSYAAMHADDRQLLMTIAGRCGFLIYVPALFYAGLRGANFRPDVVYRTPHTLDSMISTQSEHWVTSRHARHVNPLDLPETSSPDLARRIDAGFSKLEAPQIGDMLALSPAAVQPSPWQRALRPEEWLIAQGAAHTEAIASLGRSSDWNLHGSIVEARDEWVKYEVADFIELLSCQLRTPWTGFAALKPSQKAITAVMALFYGYDLESGGTLLNDLAALFDASKASARSMDDAIASEDGMMARIEAVLASDEGNALLEIANRHAWVESAFPVMLHYARKNRGVLPAAAFLWLKAQDRTMWYIMDNVGSEAVMIESAGAMAHSKAETQLGQPIRRPAVYQAARALLEDYLDVTPERIEMRAIKAELSKSPDQRMSEIFEHSKAEEPKDKSDPSTGSSD